MLEMSFETSYEPIQTARLFSVSLGTHNQPYSTILTLHNHDMAMKIPMKIPIKDIPRRRLRLQVFP